MTTISEPSTETDMHWIRAHVWLYTHGYTKPGREAEARQLCIQMAESDAVHRAFWLAVGQCYAPREE